MKRLFPAHLALLAVVAILSAPEAATEDGKKVHFHGYSVIRVVPTNDEQLQMLHNLANAPELEADLTYSNKLSFWVHPSGISKPVDIMVSPDMSRSLTDQLDEVRIPHVKLITNLEKAVEDENLPPPAINLLGLINRSSGTFFQSYHRLAKIHNYLNDLAAKNPSIASITSIGRSSEGKDLKVIKIGSPSPSGNKPIAWIDGGIHAREWISPATVLYIATQMVEQYENDPEIKRLVDKYDWYILPVTNPDGYEYTHTANRMWRKTRTRTNSLFGCQGADPNRNFGFHWNQGGASSNPCSDTYAGPKPFSEPETKAISDFLTPKKGQVKIFLTVHSYSQLWLTPWGWTNAYPTGYSEMKKAADIAVTALAKVHGTKYTVGSSTNVLYVASGGSDDWAHGVLGAPYAYCLELRDTGSNGFVLPANQILPTGQETWAGVKALASYVATKV